MDTKIGPHWNSWEEIGHAIKINASGIFEKKSARYINKAWDWNIIEWHSFTAGFKCF